MSTPPDLAEKFEIIVKLGITDFEVSSNLVSFNLSSIFFPNPCLWGDYEVSCSLNLISASGSLIIGV